MANLVICSGYIVSNNDSTSDHFGRTEDATSCATRCYQARYNTRGMYNIFSQNAFVMEKKTKKKAQKKVGNIVHLQ